MQQVQKWGYWPVHPSERFKGNVLTLGLGGGAHTVQVNLIDLEILNLFNAMLP